MAHTEPSQSIILDPEQENAIRLMNSGNINVFLTGGGGTGKSKVIETFITNYKKKISNYVATIIGYNKYNRLKRSSYWWNNDS